MFTGLVREVGVVASASAGAHGGLRVEVEAPATAAAAAVGDSVSVAGCCLTAVAVSDGRLSFELVPETVSRTSLDRLGPGDRVNVEPSLRAGDQLGGHFVQGHVDAVGTVRSVEPEGDGRRVWVDAPADVMRYVVEKGSIAVDGTSVTVAALDDDGFAVALVPHTLAATTFGEREHGDRVNLEVDVLAKYVERSLRG
jgi:riboflavin synthase